MTDYSGKNIGSHLPAYKKVVGNTLIWSCTHKPFNHPEFLGFICRLRDQHKCKNFVDLGDEFDNHAMSYHETNPDGYSPGHELDRAREEQKRWNKEFPKVDVCISNHASLFYRQARTLGVPSEVFQSMQKICGTPDTWRWAPDWVYHFKESKQDVLLTHGTGTAMNTAFNLSKSEGMSVVMGHHHTECKIVHWANREHRYFACNTGWGGNIKEYAFQYSKRFKKRPILGAIVIKEEGYQAEAYTMKMGKDRARIYIK